MNATGKRRLLKLAVFLETEVPEDLFSMDVWGHGQGRGGRLHCGTAACALGWATTIPQLHQAGATFAHPGADNVFSRRRCPLRVAKDVFSMNTEQFHKIFAPPDMVDLHGKRGARIVAKRIRKLVASKAA